MNKRITKKKYGIRYSIIKQPWITWTKPNPKWKRRKQIQRACIMHGAYVGFPKSDFKTRTQNVWRLPWPSLKD
jgi:hypothetical protein|nr:MAG TPA: hypothetical protein [Bacteriophage sp.]